MNAVLAPPPDAIHERLLPHSLQRLIGAIGLPSTIALLEARGGTRIKLPRGRVHRKKWRLVIGLIGEEGALALAEEFSGRESLDLPKPDKILMQVRNAMLHRESADQTQAQLALRYRLTVRQVQKILATKEWPTWRKPSPQMDLLEQLGK